MAIHPDAGALPDTPRNRGDATAPHLSPATPAEDQRTILLNEIAWGAVLAGVVVALVTQLLLNMLGLGQEDFHGENVFRVETQLDSLQAENGVHHQSCSHQ